MYSSMGDAKGRDIILNDQSNKTICKNVNLWAYQDTYVSNNQNGKFYFEDGILRGRTDYLCGKGDVYYNNVELWICEKEAISLFLLSLRSMATSSKTVPSRMLLQQKI